MAEIVKMPKLSDTMTEGVVAKWHKKVGDKVKSGDLLAEIETDKATMEFESYQDGTLLYIGVEQGKAAPVDSVLAILGKEGEDIKSLLASAKNGSSQNGSSKKEETSKAETSTASAKQETKEAPKGMEGVVKMPKLSDTMTEGVVAKWHKKVGDKVKSGELLADIETDKATMEFESFQDGTLLYIGVEQGKSAPVDSVLAILGKEGDKVDVDAIVNYLKQSGSQKQEQPKEEKREEKKAVAAAPVKEAAVHKTPAPVHHGSSSNGDGRVKISPLARKLAEEKGINLNSVKGSGDFGRIIKRDIENYTPSAGGAFAPSFTGVESFTEEGVSQMRKTIARRLAESKFSAPHFYLTIEIDMDEAVKARTTINTVASVKISFNDFVIKAAAVALTKHPKVNSSWLGEKIRYYKHVNVGVAVAVDEGLLVPVVRFADGKTLSQISTEVKAYGQKAKDKKLQPSDWEGNTFTISNLGMFGIDEFTAIINPPDACIMAVGGIKQVPVVKNGQIVPGNVMKVTLSCDHRVVDGATGAAFLQTFRQLMENPVLLLGAHSI